MHYFKFFLFGAMWTTLLVVLSFVRIPFEIFNGEPLLVYFNEVSFKNLYAVTQEAKATQSSLPVAIVEKIPERERSSIDGITELEDEKGESIVALMVENHPNSRAQMSGLSKASIVYETEAEGGITRFLALFNTFQVDKVGPIRSARPYFVDFAEEYNATYGHAGGSPPALAQLQNKKLLNAEALYLEGLGKKYFFRDKNYYAPHNLFANLSNIPAFIEKKEWEGYSKKRFTFITESEKKKENSNKKTEKADEITANFSRKLYKTDYFYDAKSETYLRHMSGKKHIDNLDGSSITPSNIIVQYTEYKPYDNYGRLNMRTTGSGDALLFSRGKVFKGVWEKQKDGITLFKDLNGEEFKLTPGQTWVAVIKSGLVSWKDSSAKESEDIDQN